MQYHPFPRQYREVMPAEWRECETRIGAREQVSVRNVRSEAKVPGQQVRVSRMATVVEGRDGKFLGVQFF